MVSPSPSLGSPLQYWSYDYPSCEEILQVQPKSPLAQLEAIPFYPVSCYLGGDRPPPHYALLSGSCGVRRSALSPLFSRLNTPSASRRSSWYLHSRPFASSAALLRTPRPHEHETEGRQRNLDKPAAHKVVPGCRPPHGSVTAWGCGRNRGSRGRLRGPRHRRAGVGYLSCAAPWPRSGRTAPRPRRRPPPAAGAGGPCAQRDPRPRRPGTAPATAWRPRGDGHGQARDTGTAAARPSAGEGKRRLPTSRRKLGPGERGPVPPGAGNLPERGHGPTARAAPRKGEGLAARTARFLLCEGAELHSWKGLKQPGAGSGGWVGSCAQCILYLWGLQCCCAHGPSCPRAAPRLPSRHSGIS